MIPTYLTVKAAPPDDGRSSLVTLNGALLLANVLFLILGTLTLVAGIAVLMLSRAADRAKDQEIATLRIQAAAATTTAAGRMTEVEARMLAWLSLHLPSPAAQAEHPMLAAPPVPMHLAPPPRPSLALAAPSAERHDVEILPPATQDPAIDQTVRFQRRLTDAQRQRMEAILRLAPSLIMITTDGRSEPERFADELQSAFEGAGWHVERAVYASRNRPLAPLSANLKATPIDVAVSGAFAATGLPLKPRDPPQANADREIFVGALRPGAASAPATGP